MRRYRRTGKIRSRYPDDSPDIPADVPETLVANPKDIYQSLRDTLTKCIDEYTAEFSLVRQQSRFFGSLTSALGKVNFKQQNWTTCNGRGYMISLAFFQEFFEQWSSIHRDSIIDASLNEGESKWYTEQMDHPCYYVLVKDKSSERQTGALLDGFNNTVTFPEYFNDDYEQFVTQLPPSVIAANPLSAFDYFKSVMGANTTKKMKTNALDYREYLLRAAYYYNSIQDYAMIRDFTLAANALNELLRAVSIKPPDAYRDNMLLKLLITPKAFDEWMFFSYNEEVIY